MNITPFLQALENRLNEYKKRMNYTYFDSYSVFASEGSKYFKVYKTENKSGTLMENGKKKGSIVCFVDKVTGDIYKPATFRAPAKHARGNVLSVQSGMEGFTAEGNVIYLK